MYQISLMPLVHLSVWNQELKVPDSSKVSLAARTDFHVGDCFDVNSAFLSSFH